MSINIVSRNGYHDKETTKTNIIEVQEAWKFTDVLTHVLSIEQLPPSSSFHVLKAQVHNGDEESLKRPGPSWPKRVSRSHKCLYPFACARRSTCARATLTTTVCPSLLPMQVHLEMPVVQIMQAFTGARDILFQLRIADGEDMDACEQVAGAGGGTSAHATNAFALLREGSRRLSAGAARSSGGSQPLPPPVYNLTNAKIQLEFDVHEVLDSLGLGAPVSEHEYLKRLLKIVVNFLWYIDPYHHILRRRRGQLPKEFLHIAENTYNNYKEKKQKAPPLQAGTLEGHVNDLFSVLAMPTLKLPCNARVLDVLTEMANMGALQVSLMKKQAAGMRTRREQLVLNDGKVAISFMEKRPGPFLREIDKTIIREFRSLVCALPFVTRALSTT